MIGRINRGRTPETAENQFKMSNINCRRRMGGQTTYFGNAA